MNTHEDILNMIATDAITPPTQHAAPEPQQKHSAQSEVEVLQTTPETLREIEQTIRIAYGGDTSCPSGRVDEILSGLLCRLRTAEAESVHQQQQACAWAMSAGKAEKQRDAARAEVARLTALLQVEQIEKELKDNARTNPLP